MEDIRRKENVNMKQKPNASLSLFAVYQTP